MPNNSNKKFLKEHQKSYPQYLNHYVNETELMRQRDCKSFSDAVSIIFCACLCPPVTIAWRAMYTLEGFALRGGLKYQSGKKVFKPKADQKAQHIIFRSRTLLLLC